MCHCNIHPTIFVEVEDGNAACLRCGYGVERDLLEGAFSLVFIHDRCAAGAGDDEVYGAVVVDVREHGGDGASGSAETGRLGPLGKGGVAVIAPKDVWRAAWSGRASADEEVEVAVVIEVDEGESGGMIERFQADGRSHIGELSVAEIMKEGDAI